MSTLDPLSTEKIVRPDVTITEADVDTVLGNLREQRKRWTPVTRRARLGDRITLNYTARYRGRVVEAREAEPLVIILGEDRFHRNIERRTLVGMTRGQRASARAQLPQNLPNRELSGKRATYEIYVADVSRPALPRIDERFAKELGLEGAGGKTLRKEILKIMQREVDALIKRNVYRQLFEKLLERYPVHIGAEELRHEVEQRISAMEDARRAAGKDAGPENHDVEQVEAFAKLSMIVQDIVRKHDIRLDAKRFSVAANAFAMRTDDPEQTLEDLNSDFTAQSRIEAEVLEDQALEEALRHVDIRKEPVSYEALMKSAQPAKSVLPNWPVVQLRRDNKCAFCANSNCCTYVTQAIPTPRSKIDFDHLLWAVSHENVELFKDEDGWQLLFRTRCSHLRSDGRCGIYEMRPTICRDYSNESCEFAGPAPHLEYFKDYDSLLAFCETRFSKRKQKEPAAIASRRAPRSLGKSG